jgi:hypothetical protein
MGIDYSINLTSNSIEPIYQSILSLNMQTLNINELCNQNDNNNYNTLFFQNYINQNYNIESINIYDYDFDKYFVNTYNPIEYHNINNHIPENTLYNKIIETDLNLLEPLILNLNYTSLFINLDLINLYKNLINFNFLNNYIYRLTK